MLLGASKAGTLKSRGKIEVYRWALATVALAIPLLGQVPAGSPIGTAPIPGELIILPAEIPDPIEPFNRVMWSFNKGLMMDVINPTARAYRFVIVKPIRRAISNVNRNLLYPGRAINNLLQARWTGARDETYRFLVNSTLGVGGIFDMATPYEIPKSDADFGQTFGHWGWKPACFIMLPVFGPSSERDTVGLVADTAANPLLYVSPYSFNKNNPLTYLGAYSYFSYGAMYNRLSDSVGEYVRFSESEMDPYAEIRLAWTFARKNQPADMRVTGTEDKPSLDTVRSVLFNYQDPEFPVHARTRSVQIPSTGRRLPFSYWLQPGKAPLVYILPGLGGHRLSQTTVALAELLYGKGYSVVSVSNPFHSEFMERASSAALPGYLPVDAQDVHVALSEIDRRLTQLYPGRTGQKALLGYSMGALDTLYIAAEKPNDYPSLVQFDRFIAISTPVSLMHGIGKLDEFYQAPLEWPAAERARNLENLYLKVAALVKDGLSTKTPLPFNSIESRFLIGMTFRSILRDIVFSSQRRTSQHVLRHSTANLNRKRVYQEIRQYSFQEYFDDFAAPYYEGGAVSRLTPGTLARAGNLRSYEDGLRANPKIRLVINRNDFLLEDQDVTWLQATFSDEQLTIFPDGGHLGNLFVPEVQHAILGALPEPIVLTP